MNISSSHLFAMIMLGLPILLFLAQLFASERIEVVELHTSNEALEEITTRLWVVDDDGYQYLRVGSEGSDWFNRLQATGTIDVTRNGRRYEYSWSLRPDKSTEINSLMQHKYGWGDSFVGLLTGGRVGSIPIELKLAQ
tara:strand:- start:356 stop:769 length:414 start_codon:yes stop_codon:yes gene_type:complete